ncbi:hypothetical protein [Roseateles agri]|nr:hypothetical protein [Paucibacter sp. R3-3]
MLMLCPAAAVLGSFVHMFMVENDFSQMPKLNEERGVVNRIEKSVFSLASWFSVFNQKRWYWIWGRVTVGVAVGMLVALYFVGAINPGAANSAKVLALSVLAGYLAPKLFIAQERAVSQALDKKLPPIVDEAIERVNKSKES